MSWFINSPVHCIGESILIRGHFADALKISVIKPVHKKGEAADINNYRPIALYQRQLKYSNRLWIPFVFLLRKNKNLNENQNGFRKTHSTTLAIYKYLKNMLNEINNKTFASRLSLAMSKAHDCFLLRLYYIYYIKLELGE